MNTAQTILKISKDENKYVCDTCGNGFKSKSTLIRHQRIHSGEKPYSCGDCDKSFNQKSSLKRHQLTHSGLKIYQCDVCKRCFSQRSSLKQLFTLMTNHLNVNSVINDLLKNLV